MPIKYKIDVLSALKQAGYNTNRIRNEQLLSQSTLQKLRKKEPLAWKNIETICKLLGCQPGDIMEYVDDEEKEA